MSTVGCDLPHADKHTSKSANRMVDESASVSNARVSESDPSSACSVTELSLSVPSSTPVRGI